VIDARSSGEFGTVHIHGSSNVPLPLLGKNAAQLADRIGHRAVLVYQSGPRGTDAQRRLAAVGMTDLHVLEGGAPGVDRARDPVVRDHRRWAVELQVRLAAGLLVAAAAMGSLGKRAMAQVPIDAADNRGGEPVEPAAPLEALPPRREVGSR
jgi:rhodanese-related sulfurtransferase